MFRIKPHPLLPIDESLPRRTRAAEYSRLQLWASRSQTRGPRQAPANSDPAGSDLLLLFIGISIWVLDVAFWCVGIYWFVS